MAEKIIDLLTDKEKSHYYEIRLKMHQVKNEQHHKHLYQKASEVLLQAVNREIAWREVTKVKI